MIKYRTRFNKIEAIEIERETEKQIVLKDTKYNQPHGVIDLHPTVGMAAGLALDTLLAKVPASCRRVWMGDPAVVEANGGILRETFTDRLMMREFVWP